METDIQVTEFAAQTTNAATIKQAILDRMLKDKTITNAQHAEYNVKWQFVVIKKSWFKQIWGKLSLSDQNVHVFKLVKFED